MNHYHETVSEARSTLAHKVGTKGETAGIAEAQVWAILALAEAVHEVAEAVQNVASEFDRRPPRR